MMRLSSAYFNVKISSLNEPRPVRIPFEWPDSVVYICKTKFTGGRTDYRPVATGFFMAVPGGSPSRPVHYLITAKHVIDNFSMDEAIAVRVNSDLNGVQFMQYDKKDWITHPTADVAAVLFGRGTSPSDPFSYRLIPCEALIAEDYKQTDPVFGFEDRVALGDEVCFIGLFSQHKGNERNLPIARFGSISRLPDEAIEMTLRSEVGGSFKYSSPALLAECRSWGGHSGSPVFWTHDRWFKAKGSDVPNRASYRALLGLVSAHFDINIVGTVDAPTKTIEGFEGKRSEVKNEHVESFSVPANSGIAVVTPASFISELLLGETAKIEREDFCRQVDIATTPEATPDSAEYPGVE